MLPLSWQNQYLASAQCPTLHQTSFFIFYFFLKIFFFKFKSIISLREKMFKGLPRALPRSATSAIILPRLLEAQTSLGVCFSLKETHLPANSKIYILFRILLFFFFTKKSILGWFYVHWLTYSFNSCRVPRCMAVPLFCGHLLAIRFISTLLLPLVALYKHHLFCLCGLPVG